MEIQILFDQIFVSFFTSLLSKLIYHKECYFLLL